jgi:hypothetical protein
MNHAPPRDIFMNGLADQPGSNRRAFLRACARYPILAGLALLGGVLALRRDDASATVPCLKQRACSGCGAFAGCALPQAVATRKNPS